MLMEFLIFIAFSVQFSAPENPSMHPVPVPAPSLDFAGITWLVAVCGQCAVHFQGLPKSVFHPYVSCCHLGCRSSTHRSGSLCIGFETEGRAGHEGPDSPGHPNGGMVEHGGGGWSDGRGQQ